MRTVWRSRQPGRFSVAHFALASLLAISGVFATATGSWSQTVINTVQDLQSINNNLSGSYVLGRDINATTTASWNGGKGFIPIGNINAPFTGTFDGQGHIINGLTSSYSPIFYSGLFGLLGQSGIVKNVGVTNANIATGFISGEGGGVLVGFNVGTVTNSYATGAINGGNFSGNVGGLVGTNGALVTESYADVAVTGNGIFSYGGLVGDNAGTISPSYATGPVSATAQSIGGLVGLNLGTVTTSYWDTQTTGRANSAGGTGLTTAQLQSGTLPTGFDPMVWVAIQGQYPQFSQFPISTAVPPINTFPTTLLGVSSFLQAHLSEFSPSSQMFLNQTLAQAGSLLTQTAKVLAQAYAPLPSQVGFYLGLFSLPHDFTSLQEAQSVFDAVKAETAIGNDLIGSFAPASVRNSTIFQATEAFISFATFLTDDNPLGAAVAAAGFISLYLPQWGDALSQFGSDPPDSNFQSAYKPSLFPSPIFAQLSGPLGSAVNNAASSVTEAAIYLDAVNKSFDRYQGAITAKDPVHAALQLEAILFYLASYNNTVKNASPALGQFNTLLASLVGGNGTLNTTQLAALQANWGANGLPAQVNSYLANLGLSDADIRALLTAFTATNLSALRGSIYAETSDLGATLSLIASHDRTIGALLTEVNIAGQEGFIDNQGIVNSLVSKLNAAQAALSRKQEAVAAQNLRSFSNEVSAQSGKHIQSGTANLLIFDADNCCAL